MLTRLRASFPAFITAVFVLIASVAGATARAQDEAPADPTDATPDATSDATQDATSDGAPAELAAPPGDAPRASPLPALSADAGVPFDAAAEAAYRACDTRARVGSRDDARACFRELIARAPHTEAALKASAALAMLELELTPPQVAADEVETPGTLIPAGRLGTTAAAGLFGAWTAIAAGLMVAPWGVDGRLVIAGAGVGAIALGIGAGVGGYLLADTLALDEGAGRLVASSLVWGTVLGVGVAPMVYTALAPTPNVNGPTIDEQVRYRLAFDAAILSVVAAGAGGGLGAVALTSRLSLDEAQVGWINSGGVVGATLGTLTVLVLASEGVSNVYALGGAFMGVTLAGLGGGAALGQLLDTTWGEVLLCDLAGVLGGVGGAALGIAFAGSTGVIGVAATTSIGLVGGYGLGIGIVEGWRSSRGAPLLRDGPRWRPTTVSLVDITGARTVGVGIKGAW